MLEKVRRLFAPTEATRPERLGFHEEVRDTAIQALSESILRTAVNTAVVTLAMYDIAVHNFYRRQINEMLGSWTGPLGWVEDLPDRLRPYVSDDFGRLIRSQVGEVLIGEFTRYFLTRHPAVVLHQWFSDVPEEIGPTPEDLTAIAASVSTSVQDLFPTAWKCLEGRGRDHPESIYHQFAEGKLLAERHEFRSSTVRDFATSRDALVSVPIEQLQHLGMNSNMKMLIGAALKRQVSSSWYGFQTDYQDTFKQWLFGGGAFIGRDREPSPVLWPALRAKLSVREWLIRIGGW